MSSVETIWTWAFHCQVVDSFLIIKSNCISYRSIHIVSFFLSSFCLIIFSSILIYFNWKIITLQYYEVFCHPSTWISHKYTCVSPSCNPLLTSLHTLSPWVIPEHQLWCPASCIKLALIICFAYGNVHVSVLFSQITPLLPSPTESKSLFFTSMSLLLPCT